MRNFIEELKQAALKNLTLNIGKTASLIGDFLVLLTLQSSKPRPKAEFVQVECRQPVV